MELRIALRRLEAALRQEARILRAACDERLAIIRKLEEAARSRDALVASLREELAQARGDRLATDRSASITRPAAPESER